MKPIAVVLIVSAILACVLVPFFVVPKRGSPKPEQVQQSAS
jgi:hypothetical protein